MKKLLFLLSFPCLAIDNMPNYVNKTIEATLKIPTVNTYKGNTEKYGLKQIKNKTNINKNQLIIFGATGYTLSTGKIDSDKFFKLNIRSIGADFKPSIKYDTRNSEGVFNIAVIATF